MIINAIKVSTRGRAWILRVFRTISLLLLRGGGNRSGDVCASRWGGGRGRGSSRLIGCSPNYERIMVSLVIWARFCTVNREWRELYGGLCKCVQGRLKYLTCGRTFFVLARWFVWIYKASLYLRALLSGVGAAAGLIEIVTNRHARWRWNYIDECMFVQLTRPPSAPVYVYPGAWILEIVCLTMWSFRLLGIWFYSRWRVTAYSSLISLA